MTASQQPQLAFPSPPHPSGLLPDVSAFYHTPLGAAYLGDAHDVLSQLPDASVNLICTSPPYALQLQKNYGNVSNVEYVQWFLKFARDMHRVLRDDGSLVLNIGGTYNEGVPTRSTYHFKVVLAMVEELGFYLAQECFWYNPAKMPMPAEWVTIKRIRVKDAVEYVWWFSKTAWPKANNRRVLRPYGDDMWRLNKRGVRPTKRPSGHTITKAFDKVHAGGSIPPNVVEEELVAEEPPHNVLKAGNNAANDMYTRRCKEAGIKIHPARFPAALPDFFIKLLTEEGDVVVDPFSGSNTTGMVAEQRGRRWIAVEKFEHYIEASKFRFASIITPAAG